MKKKYHWYQIQETEGKKYFKAFRYWLAQGMRHAHNTERVYKIIFELFLIILFGGILYFYSELNYWLIAVIALFAAHNINFLINCSVWETLICDLGFRGVGKKKLVEYVKSIRTRAPNYKSIACVFLYGSIARGEMHDSSDLDVIFVRKTGFINSIKGLYVITREKIISLFSRVPFEAFLADDISFAERPMESEKIIIIDDKEGLFEDFHRETQTIEEAEKMNFDTEE